MIEEINLKQKKSPANNLVKQFLDFKRIFKHCGHATTRDFQDKHRLTFLALSQILVTFQAIFTQSKYPVLEGLIIVLKNH